MSLVEKLLLADWESEQRMSAAWAAAAALTDAEKRKLVVELVKVLEREEGGLRDVPPTPAFTTSPPIAAQVAPFAELEPDATQIDKCEALLAQHPEGLTSFQVATAIGCQGTIHSTLDWLRTLVHVVDERRAVSASMAFRVARVVGVKVDDLLLGKWPEAGTCPRCGYKDERNLPAPPRTTSSRTRSPR